MQDFIVLGIVPGTQIQLEFTFWLYVSIGFFGLLVLRSIYKHINFRRYFAIRKIAHTIDNYDLAF